MHYSIINKSELEGAQRIDAEYYQPTNLSLSKKVRSKRYSTLDSIAFVTDGEHGSPDWDESSNIKYVVAETIRENYINDENFQTISEKQFKRNERAALREDDLLIYSVGMNAGLSAVVEPQLLPASIPRSVALARLNKNFLPEYVSIFLNSKFGKFQTKRLTAGNAQPMLALDNIKQLEIADIPISSQQTFKNLYEEAYRLRVAAKSFYSQAEKVLLEELGIKESDFGDELSYVVDFAEAGKRTDAEYFQPKYQKLVGKLRANGSKRLGGLVSVKKGFEPGSEAYQDEGRLFIRVSSLSKFGIQNLDQKYLSDELYEKLKQDYEPQAGEILLSKDATLGIAYVVSEPVEGIISGGILRLKLKADIDSEYLALVINSLVGQMQVERDAGGSIIKHWKPDQVKDLEIPILPKATQEKIGELVRKSHEARQKSKELLEDAKRQVEELIEKPSQNIQTEYLLDKMSD